eukprot:CAMPEP_0205927508 /NCGR_PEP_ID=MMETSP1325-20131115/22753_1 /ASSEMBLY_ACC=CAM_ASM_000708 /TAXON_ID=236786 /ORGANISM="Florenciella sp., Strain RCC1007" /LENGTH=33 /DNA_ID= /DNA_START= /DNA_END= /DNA_ORIENTATION=
MRLEDVLEVGSTDAADRNVRGAVRRVRDERPKV